MVFYTPKCRTSGGVVERGTPPRNIKLDQNQSGAVRQQRENPFCVPCRKPQDLRENLLSIKYMFSFLYNVCSKHLWLEQMLVRCAQKRM
jgi:hypothetical protein